MELSPFGARDYCRSTLRTLRLETREVRVGGVGIGGDNPIRIQSMTTTDTLDVRGTADQIARLADAGCELVRVTVQRPREARACEAIKNAIVARGYSIPLIADIHFLPAAAMAVADFADKIRINPGNFVDERATFKTVELDEEAYGRCLERVEERFAPLVSKCRSRGIAMRIGANHGSLSDRIMTRYGDSPRGMVESAFEYARICRKLDFHDIVFSMKASNTRVMVEAYRLLAAEQMRLGWSYPCHLGVTEAGSDEDGRIKSAIGIGALLIDGIGDTIRASLTEDPWDEVDPCLRLRELAEAYAREGASTARTRLQSAGRVMPDERPARSRAARIPAGAACVRLSESELLAESLFDDLGLVCRNGRWKKSPHGGVDLLVLSGAEALGVRAKRVVQELTALGLVVSGAGDAAGCPQWVELADLGEAAPIRADHLVRVRDFVEEDLALLLEAPPTAVLLAPRVDRVHRARRFFDWVHREGFRAPVILDLSEDADPGDALIRSAAEYGALLVDGLGDGVCISAGSDVAERARLALGVLQGSRVRLSKTEFVSCPECGRTLFSLREVEAKIKQRTGHLPGVIIAVMGCIVNGPGEMADADFGYVGSKPGKVDLYVGRNCHARGVDAEEAPDRLVELIKAHGRWVDPPEIEAARGPVPSLAAPPSP